MKLRTRLTIAFMLLTLLVVGLLMLASNLLLEHQFRSYAGKQQDRKNQALAETLSLQLTRMEGVWSDIWLEPLCQLALENRQILTIVDSQGQIIWDAHTHDNQHCEMIIAEMERNTTRGGRLSGQVYTTLSYPVMQGDSQAATLHVGSFGPYFLTDDDILFMRSLNRLFALFGAVFLLIAWILGRNVAIRLAKPVGQACGIAERIAKGEYGAHMPAQSNIHELAELAQAINQLSDQLADQENMRARLTRDMAHELRTPLATLQSYLEAMLDGIWQPDQQRIQVCHGEVMRLSRLVSDLGELALYEQETLVLDCSRFDLAEVVQAAAEAFLPRIHASQLQLVLETEPCLIRGDRDKISQILVNLLENALQYTAEGFIHLTLKAADGWAEIEIKDSGIGVAARHLDHLFDRFYRVDQARRRNTGGSGIGLSIARAIARAHGGDITVKSQENIGSCFSVRLPVDAAAV